MAVTGVGERWQGRGASVDEQGVRTLKRQWIVETDDDATGESAVVDAVLLFDNTAALYYPHPQYVFAICRSLDIEPSASAKQWFVTAKYSSAAFGSAGDGSGVGGNDSTPAGSSAPGSGGGQSNSTPAEQRPPTLAVTKRDVTELLEKDLDGDPVVNNLGDPFIPPPEVRRSKRVFTWKFFRRPDQLQWDQRDQWLDSINGDDVYILGKTYPRGTLWCADYSFETVWENSSTGLSFYFALTAQAEYDPRGWDVVLLNTGRRKLVSGEIGNPFDPPVLAVVTDQAGQPVADPVPLTATGEQWVTGDDYEYLDDYIGYREYNWLGAGSSLTGAGGFLA